MTTNGEAGGNVTTRCLIVDDQAMVREGFAAVLAAQPGLLVVGQAADGADAVRQARHLEPDVVLMDVRMPVMDGLHATCQILSAAASPARPRVLMLTTFDLNECVYEALRASASGFSSRTPPPPSSSTPSAWSPPATPCSPPLSPGG
jgi:DNA-binding NarL/FixJ family response regulator